RGRQALRRRLERLGLPFAALLVPVAGQRVSAALRSVTLTTVCTDLAGGTVAPAGAELARCGTGLLGLARSKLLVALVLVAGVLGIGVAGALGPLSAPPSLSPSVESSPTSEEKLQTRVDLVGDPLPPDALLRLGTLRHRIVTIWGSYVDLPDGKTLLMH